MIINFQLYYDTDIDSDLYPEGLDLESRENYCIYCGTEEAIETISEEDEHGRALNHEKCINCGRIQ